MSTAFLSLGSNEGNREEWLQHALADISETCGTIATQSSTYETAAWGLNEQPDFLNMALRLDTTLSPSELLLAIQDIEKNLGRQRTVKWGQRTIDIDILFFNDEIIDTPPLTIPHPQLHERRFVLVPLADIAANIVHPTLHTTIAALLAQCPDTLEVRKIKQPQR